MLKRAKHQAACLTAALLSCLGSAQADSVACHITYGGETQIIEVQPTTQPYTVAPHAIGSFFLFRIVFRQEPADLASVKLYTYADRDRSPSIIHQASYPLPLTHATANGFTGLNSVYEQTHDGELQYWCELKTGAAK